MTNCYNTGSVVKSDGTGQGAIIGMNNNDRAAVSNCYWLEGTADKGIGSGTDNTVSKPADDFASGEVCYLLNNSVSGDDNIWRQNLGEDGDDAPVPDSTHGIVYRNYIDSIRMTTASAPSAASTSPPLWRGIPTRSPTPDSCSGLRPWSTAPWRAWNKKPPPMRC